jgi:thiol-disulfide isomerase/thioredoxin
MRDFYLGLFLFLALTFGIFSEVPAQQQDAAPKTPTEAFERATMPLRDFFKSKDQTLEGNIKANKEKERLAKQYSQMFKPSEWTGKEAFSLAQLYETANQPANAEKALKIYLNSSEPDQLAKATTMLLNALLNQKEFTGAIPVAEQLLNEPKYNQDIILAVQELINNLRPTDIKRAVSIAEKRFPKLMKYAEDHIGNPGHAAVMVNSALDLAAMYEEAGETAKSKEFVSSFLSQFNSSPLSSEKRIKQNVDAALLRSKLIGAQAPAIEAVEYIDMAQTSVADLRGRVVMLDFLAHWCAPCIASFPETNLLKQKYESQGLTIVGVTSYYGFFADQEKLSLTEELAALKKLKSQKNANFGFLIGPRTNETTYGVAGLPAVALIDRQGKIRYIKQGADYKKDIEKIIQKLVAESARN